MLRERRFDTGLFGLGDGLALGLALEDRPVPGGTQTSVRTLEPLPQEEP